MSISNTERARIAGRARGKKVPPERQSEIGRLGHLTGAVNAIVARAPELSPDQIARLQAALAPVACREVSRT